jgi:hypothetical protein
MLTLPLAWLSAVTLFASRVNISPIQTFPGPLSLRFEVQNNGFFSVYDVHLSATANGRMGSMVIGRGRKEDETPELRKWWEAVKQDPRFQSQHLYPSAISRIGPGQKPATEMSFSLFQFRSREGGDGIDAVVSAVYRPAFAWWHKTTKHRFVTIRSQDGSLGWIEQPIASKEDLVALYYLVGEAHPLQKPGFNVRFPLPRKNDSPELD